MYEFVYFLPCKAKSKKNIFRSCFVRIYGASICLRFYLTFRWCGGGTLSTSFFNLKKWVTSFSFNLEIPNIWSPKYQWSINFWRKCQLFKLGCGKLCQEDTLGSLTSFNLECPTSLSFYVVVWCFNYKNKKSLNWILDSRNKLCLKNIKHILISVVCMYTSQWT